MKYIEKSRQLFSFEWKERERVSVGQEVRAGGKMKEGGEECSGQREQTVKARECLWMLEGEKGR